MADNNKDFNLSDTDGNVIVNNSNSDNNSDDTKGSDNNAVNDVKNLNISLSGDLIDQIVQAKTEKLEDKIKIALQKGIEMTKQQLYPEISRLKSKLSELESLSAQAKELDVKGELIKSLEAQKIDYENKIRNMEELMQKTNSELNELTHKIKQTELESYRNKLIADNKGKIVESLVKGNSIEELNASLEVAKQEYEKIVEQFKNEYRIPEKPTADDVTRTPIEVKRINPTDRSQALTWEQEKKKILEDLIKSGVISTK